MIAHHTQHVLAVVAVAGERSVLCCKQGALCVRAAGEDRGQHSADGAAFLAVVGDARLHEHGAKIRVAEAERAIAPRAVGNFARRECGHQHRDLKHDCPNIDRVLIALDVETAALCVVELEEIDRREVARGVVEEHVLRARIRRVDATASGAGVPRVDRAVVLDARVCAAPRGKVDLVPEFLCLDGLRNLAIHTADQVPIAVGVERIEERIRDADGVVRVLAADGVVGLTVEVVVELEPELLRQRLLVVTEYLHAFDQRRDLDLLANLPVDEAFDVRVIEVKADHLGSATSCAARLDGTRSAIADLEEAHEARALTAARERLVLAAEL